MEFSMAGIGLLLNTVRLYPVSGLVRPWDPPLSPVFLGGFSLTHYGFYTILVG